MVFGHSTDLRRFPAALMFCNSVSRWPNTNWYQVWQYLYAINIYNGNKGNAFTSHFLFEKIQIKASFQIASSVWTIPLPDDPIGEDDYKAVMGEGEEKVEIKSNKRSVLSDCNILFCLITTSSLLILLVRNIFCSYSYWFINCI